MFRGKHKIIFEVNYFWGPVGLDFRPLFFFIIHKCLTKLNFLKAIVFADGIALIQSDNNLGKT